VGDSLGLLAIGLLLIFIWWMFRQVTANNKVISEQTRLHRVLNDLQAEFTKERGEWMNIFFDKSTSLEEQVECTAKHQLKLSDISRRIEETLVEINKLDRQ
jgi:hypothetical protein